MKHCKSLMRGLMHACGELKSVLLCRWDPYLSMRTGIPFLEW